MGRGEEFPSGRVIGHFGSVFAGATGGLSASVFGEEHWQTSCQWHPVAYPSAQTPNPQTRNPKP